MTFIPLIMPLLIAVPFGPLAGLEARRPLRLRVGAPRRAASRAVPAPAE
jgi:hypothetical protein